MRILLLVATALVGLCRLAYAGEGGVSAESAFFRLVCDFGGLGVLVAVLLYDKREERKRRAEADARWHALDCKLVELIDRCASAITECAAAIAEMHSILRDHGRKISDVVKRQPTRVIRRNETETE